MTALSIDDPVYFDQLAAIENGHWWSRGMWRIASGWFDLALHGRSQLCALDIGCGAGGTLRKLAIRPEIQRVIGLDPSPEALCHATDWDVCLGSALNLPFSNASLDVVTCFDVLQHLPPSGDAVALREIARILRPRGVAILRTNGRGLWPDTTRSETPYDRRKLVRLACENELSVRRSTYANCLPSMVTEGLGRFSQKASANHGHPQGRGLRIQTVSPFRNRLMAAISTFEAVAITRLGVRLPIGHSVMMLVEKPGELTP